MRVWRYALIALYVALSMAGVVVSRKHFAIGMSSVAVGLACISFHLVLERRERLREEALQVAWEAEIRRIADDVTLEAYGITSLTELARYHDAAGRAEVLEALQALPAGQRSLLAAARQVDPEAVWD